MAKGKRKPAPPPPIVATPEERKMMDFLSRFYSVGQLQIWLWDLKDGFPKDMSERQRKLRIKALKLLGFQDRRKNAPVVDED